MDYGKAIDSLDRPLLCQTLSSHNVNDKLLNAIRNMYAKHKSYTEI